MDARSAISRAKQLLIDGKLTEAQDLLLDAGYRNLDADVQHAYLSLIPINEMLDRVLSIHLKELRDTKLAVRIKAAKWISTQARGEVSRELTAWLKDPRTMDCLLPALHDPDRRVIEEVASAITHICWRYYPDMRAYSALLPLLKNPSSTLRFTAVWGIGTLRRDDYLDHLLPLLQDRVGKVRTEVIRILMDRSLSRKLTAPEKKRLRPVFADCLGDKDPQVRGGAAAALREIGDQSVLATLKTAMIKEKHVGVKDSLNRAISTISERK